MTEGHLSPAERELRNRIRLQLRRMEHGLDHEEALEGIIEAIRD